jgi:hypothetical protein
MPARLCFEELKIAISKSATAIAASSTLTQRPRNNRRRVRLALAKSDMPYSILCRDGANTTSVRYRQMASARRLLRVITPDRCSRRRQA